MTADLFANQELPPVVAPGDFPLSPRTEGNAGAAPITIRFPEHVLAAGDPLSFRSRPCAFCGGEAPFGRRGSRVSIFTCAKHRACCDGVA